MECLFKTKHKFRKKLSGLTFESCEAKHSETNAIVNLSGNGAGTGVRGCSTMLPIGFQLGDASLAPMD